MDRPLKIGDVFETKNGDRGLVVDIRTHPSGTGHGPHDVFPPYDEVFYNPLPKGGDFHNGDVSSMVYAGNRVAYMSFLQGWNARTDEYLPKNLKLLAEFQRVATWRFEPICIL